MDRDSALWQLHSRETNYGLEFRDPNDVLAAHILDGRSSIPPVIGQGILETRLRTGDCVFAFTDPGYGRNPNEDRVIIDLENSSVCILDGYGQKGAAAADIIARRMLDDTDLDVRGEAAVQELGDRVPIDTGACMMYSGIVTGDGKKYLGYAQSGDVRLIRTMKSRILHRSRNQTLAQEMIDAGSMSEDQALYAAHERRVVTNSVAKMSMWRPDMVGLEEPLQPGERIYMYSDGIDDNFTPEELMELVGDLPPEQAIQKIAEMTTARM